MGGKTEFSEGLATVADAPQAPASFQRRKLSISKPRKRADVSRRGGVIRTDDRRRVNGDGTVGAVEGATKRATDHDPVATAWSIHATVARVDQERRQQGLLRVGRSRSPCSWASCPSPASNVSCPACRASWQLGIFWLGVVGLITSMLLVLWVVSPHLRAPADRYEYESNVIFFGHAKFWIPQELARSCQDDDILPMLPRQIPPPATSRGRNIASPVVSILRLGDRRHPRRRRRRDERARVVTPARHAMSPSIRTSLSWRRRRSPNRRPWWCRDRRDARLLRHLRVHDA